MKAGELNKGGDTEAELTPELGCTVVKWNIEMNR